jgi:hypothetical protein
VNTVSELKDGWPDRIKPEKLPFSDNIRRSPGLRVTIPLSRFLTRSYVVKLQVLKQTNHVLYLAAWPQWPVIKFCTSTRSETKAQNSSALQRSWPKAGFVTETFLKKTAENNSYKTNTKL